MIVLSIALTEGCNLNCAYCNVNKQSKESIDPELFLEYYRQVRAENPNERIKIDFYGGEPLIYFDKIKHVIEGIEDDNLQYFMPTNGLLLTESMLEYLNNHEVEISLSYDGLWQDANRPQATGLRPSSLPYKEKRDFFRTIPNFKIHSMIYPGNYNLLENHLYLSEYGANPHFTLIEDIGVWDTESTNKIIQSIDELYNWYIEDTTREFPEFFKHFLQAVVIYRAKNYKAQNCGAGSSHMSFSENKVTACNRFKDEPELEAQIPDYQIMQECLACPIKNYCKKGCIYENIKNDGPITEVCTIFKHVHVIINSLLQNQKTDENFIKVIKEMVQKEYEQ